MIFNIITSESETPTSKLFIKILLAESFGTVN